MPFGAAIMGEGTLPIRCGEILLRAGHRIVGVISPDPEVRRWARAERLDASSPADDPVAFLAREPFEYLFSIVNYSMLRGEMLALPKLGAINFHDGPLPRYAGMYATSWAILNGERKHGVAWHAAADLIDGGNILAQAAVPIEPRDTALSLNLRCYDAGAAAFEALVPLLATGQAPSQPQDLQLRTYYPAFKRPDAAAILDWRRTADELDAVVRALDFGPYPNALGLAKLDLGNELLHVALAEPTASRSGATPGTIVKSGADALVVATGLNDLSIRQLRSLTGRPVDLLQLAEEHGLSAGRPLPVLDDSARTRIGEVSEALSKHEAHWVACLASLRPPVLPRQNEGSPAAARFETVTFETGQYIDQLGAAPVTGVGVILAAFSVYLTRITGGEAFDLGVRDLAGAARIALPRPLLAEWLPMRVVVNLDAPITDAARETDHGIATLRGRGTYLREIAARYRHLAGVSPHYPAAVAIVESPADSAVPPCGCVLLLELTDDGRTARWRLDGGAFGADTIARMAAEWNALLASIAANPDRAAGDLEIMPQADVALVVTERNRTQQACPRDACLHQVVEAQVDRSPYRVAITCEGSALTYAELDASANRVAHFLLGRGVRPDDRVGICVDRSPGMLTAMLGILKAGAAYVPLDPLYPPDRLAYMIQDGGCKVILTEQALVERLPRDGVQLVCIDARPSPTEHAPFTRPAVTADPTGLAYVMYTSGSTGKPKGVEVPHRSVVNFLFACQREPGFSADDVILAVSTISFDISVTELFLPLIAGGRVEIVPRAVADDGGALGRALAESGATVLQATPATFRLLLEARWTGTPGLRVFSIGEALPRELANNLLDRVSELWNAYGPTETTVWSTVGRVAREGPVHIGHALANTTLYVVDSRLRLMPIGCTGELLIGGEGVVRGYHGRPDLTAERFLKVQYAGREERVYRTGDLVRYLPDGELECLGRIDNQVKIRGFRIELGEIESVLDRHPDVQGSVTVVREDTPGDRRLAAYVVPVGSAATRDVLVAELRARVQEALPTYMIPSAFVILDEFPLTQNGKIDRKSLPRPGPESAGPPAAHEAPRGALEQMLADAWQHALGVTNVGRSSDFFDLGGHSLLVQRLRTAIAERSGHAVSTIDVYRHPTVASLAAHLTAGAAVAAGAEEQAGETGSHWSVGRLRRLVQRFLLPRSVASLYFLVRFGAKVSPRAEVELSPLLEFGEGCVVGSFTKIKATEGPVRFGSRCGIANSCFITGGTRGIHIGDNFTCGPGVSVVSSSYIHDQLDVHIWDQGYFSLGIRIGSNVWLGANVTVLDGAELGDNTIVVAGSVVEGKHPPGVILRGNPASIASYR